MNKYRLLTVVGLISFSEAYAENLEKNTRSLEEVIVIGEKVQRSLKDTVSSVSVIDEDSLRSPQNISITGVVAEIPNVVALSGAVPDIRGVSGNGSAGGFNSISGGAKGRVSILVDGVAEPFVADLTGDSGLWDIEQVEVYRGPQSTSNGRNSIGGSIFIKTKDPSDKLEAALRTGYRDQDSYIDSAAMLSGPIFEKSLSGRISLQHLDAQTITSEQGYASNPADYDLNELTSTRARIKLKWQANTDLSALLSYSGNNEAGDTGRIYYAADDLSLRERIFYRNLDTDSDTTSLRVNYDLHGSNSLSVLIASMNYIWGFESYDEAPEDQQVLRFDEENITFDTRLNFADADDSIQGYVGLAYFERDQDINSTGAFDYFGADNSDSSAMYGEVTFGLTDKFSLTTGARVERESQLRDFTYGAIIAKLDNSNTIFLPKLVLHYAPSSHSSFALSARKGYNAAGGALDFSAGEYYYFDEETVNTFELSSRTSFANNTAFLSTNIFYNIYDGYQAVNSNRLIANMEEVVSYGAELELVMNPNYRLELKLGIGLLETEITAPGENYAEIVGNELHSAPTLSSSLGAKFRFTDSFTVGLSANYVGEYYGDISNTEDRASGDYSLVRANANYNMGSWQLSAFVNNALDEEGVKTQEPQSGRYPRGFISLVDPRTVGMSVTYTFF